ncbi:MAG: polysaccharide deacetylase family protein, partial [Balneolaceae bacterium]
MYHRLLDELPENGSDEHFTLVNEFRKQLKMIDDFGFTPITFADYQLYLEGQLELPQKPIVITFDDGYLDTFEMAVPILLELGMRAVIFVLGNRNIRRAYWDESDTTAAAPLMSDSQLRELKSLGFEIGAHSMNHLALADL